MEMMEVVEGDERKDGGGRTIEEEGVISWSEQLFLSTVTRMNALSLITSFDAVSLLREKLYKSPRMILLL